MATQRRTRKRKITKRTQAASANEEDSPLRKLYAKALGTDDSIVQQVLIQQSLAATRIQSQNPAFDQAAAILSVTSFFEELKPKDGAERLLVTQMLAAHNAAMQCYGRAMLEGQTFEGRNMNLKHAEKLSAVFARQLEALNKHRGKGQQKVTVEHVNVAAGGKAIVGNVDNSGSRSAVPPEQGEPAALAYNPAETIDLKSKKVDRTPLKPSRKKRA